MGTTIKDIASRTGLGLATISKYLNGGNVLEKNRIAIESAIEELDFQVNEFARGLKTKQSKTIGVVIPQLNNLFMTSIITNIEEVLRAHGYAVIVCDTGKTVEREKEVLQFLMSKRVDGIILLTSGSAGDGLDTVIDRGIPVVLMDRKIARFQGIVDMTLLDNFKAAYDTTNYLLERGHRDIAIVLGNPEIYTSLERLNGYKEALKNAGIPVRGEYICYTDYSMQGSYEQVKEMLEKKLPLTAVFATNFEMSLGTLLALNDKNIRIPEDMSVIGFDNRELAMVMRPKLTVVTQPLQEIGKNAAEMLLQRMNKSVDGHGRTITLYARIEEGNSVKAIGEKAES